MSGPSGPVRWDGRDLILELTVQPRAKSDEIVGIQDGRLKVRITAPPVEGKANHHLVRFLAKAFGVSRSRLELLHGATGRIKRLRIHDPGRLPAGLQPP